MWDRRSRTRGSGLQSASSALTCRTATDRSCCATFRFGVRRKFLRLGSLFPWRRLAGDFEQYRLELPSISPKGRLGNLIRTNLRRPDRSRVGEFTFAFGEAQWRDLIHATSAGMNRSLDHAWLRSGRRGMGQMRWPSRLHIFFPNSPAKTGERSVRGSLRGTKRDEPCSERHRRRSSIFSPDSPAIAGDGSGNLICLSSKGANKGTVCFWDHDREHSPPAYENVYLIAETFSEFLDVDAYTLQQATYRLTLTDFQPN
jgi:hypothetical protein